MSRFPSANRRRLTALGLAIATLIAPSAVAHADAPADQGDPGNPLDGAQPDTPRKPTAIVAFGDSFISGEGADDYKPVVDAKGVERRFVWWNENNKSAFYCHRSENAFVEVADLPGIDARFNFACSGGMARDVTKASHSRRGGRNVKSQLAQLRQISGTHDIEAVVIGFGANNSQFTFGDVVGDCVNRFLVDAKAPDEVPALRTANNFFASLLGWQKLDYVQPCTYDQYRQYEAAIQQETLDAARVIIKELQKTEGNDFKVIMQGYTSPLTDYFSGRWVREGSQTENNNLFPKLFGVRWDGGCPVHNESLKLATKYTQFLSDTALRSRDQLASEFPALNLTYVDIQRAFDGDRQCDHGKTLDDSTLVTPLQILDTGDGQRAMYTRKTGTKRTKEEWKKMAASCRIHYQLCQESLHPNAAGHEIVGECLSAAVAATTEVVTCNRDRRTKELTFGYHPRFVKFNTSITTRPSAFKTLVDISYDFEQAGRNIAREVSVATNQANAGLPPKSSKLKGVMTIALPCSTNGHTTRINVHAWSRYHGVDFNFDPAFDVQVAACPVPRGGTTDPDPGTGKIGSIPGGVAGP